MPPQDNRRISGRSFPQRWQPQGQPTPTPMGAQRGPRPAPAPSHNREVYEPTVVGAITSGAIQRRDGFVFDPSIGLFFVDRSVGHGRAVPIAPTEILSVEVDKGPFHTTFTLNASQQAMRARGLTNAASDQLVRRVLSLLPGYVQAPPLRMKAAMLGSGQGFPPQITLTSNALIIDDRHMPGLNSTLQVIPLYLVRGIEVREGLRDGVLFASLEFSLVGRDDPMRLRGFNPAECQRLAVQFLGGGREVSAARGKAIFNGNWFESRVSLTETGIAVRTEQLTEATVELFRLPFIRSVELLTNMVQGVVGAGIRITLNDNQPLEVRGIEPENAAHLVQWFQYLRAQAHPHVAVLDHLE